MLCDIDCKREAPLTGNPSGQEFMKALDGWSEISDNIFVWDYGINFDELPQSTNISVDQNKPTINSVNV